jgi:cobalamin biosynthesis protein CobW
VNKQDLLSAAERKSVLDQLTAQIRKATKLVPSTQSVVDLGVLLGHHASAEDDMHNRLSHHEMEGEEQHDHDDFVTFIVDLPAAQDKPALMARIASTIQSHDILRLKGFADVAGSDSRLLVQAVGPRLNSYFDRPWAPAEQRTTRLVVIGEKHMDRPAIEALLRG